MNAAVGRKAMKNRLAVLAMELALTAAAAAGVAGSPAFVIRADAAPMKYTDGNIFDPEYYAAHNPDVVAALGTDPDVLYRHYFMFGKQEGRAGYDPNADVTQLTNGISGDEYNMIQLGMPYVMVRNIIGEDGTMVSQHTSAGKKQILYVWKNGFDNAAYVYINDDKVVGKSQRGIVYSTVPVTLTQYYIIRTGMTYDEVRQIMTGEGAIASMNNFFGHLNVDYEWVGTDGKSSCTITFQDGVVTGMKQTGLK